MKPLLIALALVLALPATASAAGTRITVSSSEFGPMVWGPKRQAIYVFQRDRFKESRCTGECAKAWPPVYTTGKPVAGKGARKSLLGTIRRGSRLQVTYRGRPSLNGGLWWVIGADGKRRP
jgi:predicted lipoprotein with Yx(FWY)xxD motif